MTCPSDVYKVLVAVSQEMNAIRARDGAPQHIDWYRGQPLQTSSCSEAYWDELTTQCLELVEKYKEV